MFWLRALILLAPLVPLALGYMAFRSVRENAVDRGEKSSGDTLQVGYWGDPVELDLLNGGDRISRGVASIVLEPLLRATPDGGLAPALATSWAESQDTYFYFLTEADATAAATALLELEETRWPEWGLVSVQSKGLGLHLSIGQPWPDAAGEISTVFDPTGLARISTIRVALSEPVARQFHQHYVEGALEAGQIQRVWFDGEGAYELSISGDPAPFMEELQLYYQQAAGDKVEKISVVATSAGISESTLAFDLERGRTWHDGEDFDAEDVLFTLASLQSLPDADPTGRTFRLVRDVDLPSPYQIALTYREPVAWATVSWSGLRILPSHFLQRPERGLWPEDAASRLPGTGAYKVLGSGDSGGLVLGAAGGGRRYARVHVRPFDDLLTLRVALQMEQLDLYLPELEEITSIASKGEIVSAPTGTWTIAGWNTASHPVDDPTVRRALSSAVDVPALIREELAGMGSIVPSLFPATVGTPPPLPVPISDPTAAAAALGAAGWEDAGDSRKKEGRPLKLRIVTNSEDPVRLAVARALADCWRGIGATVEVLPKPWNEIVGETLPQKDYELVLIGWNPGDSWDLTPFWHSESIPPRGNNVLGFADPQVDALLASLSKIHAPSQRDAGAAEIQQRIHSAMPGIVLYERLLPTAILPGGREVGVGHGTSLWDILRMEGGAQ